MQKCSTEGCEATALNVVIREELIYVYCDAHLGDAPGLHIVSANSVTGDPKTDAAAQDWNLAIGVHFLYHRGKHAASALA